MAKKIEAEIKSFAQVHKICIKIAIKGFKSDSSKNVFYIAPV